jgi:hypothetical protein
MYWREWTGISSQSEGSFPKRGSKRREIQCESREESLILQ